MRDWRNRCGCISHEGHASNDIHFGNSGCLLWPGERTSTNGYRTATIAGFVVLAAVVTQA